ncbi:hypothetical protein LRP50_14075 [Enterovibrio sp. ZSDZ42]|uniref:Uncharacterized protein n=1 Tax=Enterovibrio gelatinilyticus TaxID=2899819 RepID=A0ABT5R281_9GAMM|nr:hypothetical protein [Enterovibrio sp. ZSDZ42]MDD1794265.1 hypothetical protein [Enterovibrio sp. ZSDZ42]
MEVLESSISNPYLDFIDNWPTIAEPLSILLTKIDSTVTDEDTDISQYYIKADEILRSEKSISKKELYLAFESLTHILYYINAAINSYKKSHEANIISIFSASSSDVLLYLIAVKSTQLTNEDNRVLKSDQLKPFISPRLLEKFNSSMQITSEMMGIESTSNLMLKSDRKHIFYDNKKMNFN